ncbi:hypothetical protein K3G63_18210 [Hymenobacter sp. HSC-4F20]|uniref:hypothetical protein n=1 Tax=Hymenobacter sp. HSC-4F20 TaxID=2864135 RepID=UPI001C7371DB|nr:hypothetical protein [Hymenobacter sp. HSC-4F20]MBX0292387.1 hypothetical protein [Hymenobacter sp. HSC-4F20]
MKTFLSALALCVGLSFLPAASRAQTPSPTVVVRVYEIINHRNLVISYGNGKTETVKTPGAVGDKDQQESAAQIQQVVDRLYQEGYHIVSTAGGGTQGGPVTTYIFRRNQ